jgi:hypothetical protein
VVQVVAPTDSKLTCSQIDTEIAMANKYAADAKKEKNIGTGTNVAALLFWLPGLVATNMNANEAIEAANQRALHLQNLKTQKNCP